MINYNTGTLVIDRNLNIVDATEGYLGYVPEGRYNHFIENIKEEDWHLVHEMVERLADQERADICFRLCDKMANTTGLQHFAREFLLTMILLTSEYAFRIFQ